MELIYGAGFWNVCHLIGIREVKSLQKRSSTLFVNQRAWGEIWWKAKNMHKICFVCVHIL